MTESAHSLTDTIHASVDVAAQKLAVERGVTAEEIHKQRVCRFMSTEIILSLLENGVHASPDSRRPYLMDEHRYPVINLGNASEEIVVDATWQQFLPEGTDTSNLPRALVGTRSEVVAQAAQAGVRPENLRLWSPADGNTEGPYLTPQEIVARAIDSQMV